MKPETIEIPVKLKVEVEWADNPETVPKTRYTIIGTHPHAVPTAIGLFETRLEAEHRHGILVRERPDNTYYVVEVLT